jgi:hypothetical protein
MLVHNVLRGGLIQILIIPVHLPKDDTVRDVRIRPVIPEGRYFLTDRILVPHVFTNRIHIYDGLVFDYGGVTSWTRV